MPSSVIVNGVPQFKPGVYGFVDALALGAVQPSTGNLAVVGPLPSLQNDTPIVVLSPQALRSLDPANADIARLAKLCFNPCNDSRVGGATSVTLVNCQTVGQATRVINDADALATIKFAAKTYGFRGNQVWASISQPSGDANGRTLKFVQPGFAAEEFANLQSGVVVELKCTAASLIDANDTVLATTSKTEWKIAWTKRLTANAANDFNPDLLVAGESIYVKFSADSGADKILTFNGTSSTGVPVSFAQTFAQAQQNNTLVEVKNAGATVLWSKVDSVAVPVVAGATVDLSGNAFKLTTAQFSKISDLAGQINNQSAYGFVADIKSPKAYQIPANEADALATTAAVPSGVTIKNVAASVRADVWAIVQGCAGSKICTVTREATAIQRPAAAGAAMLAGGSEASVTPATDYPEALATIANKNVQVAAVLDADIEAGKALKAHCVNAAVLFGRERNGWYGCGPSLAVDTIAASVNTLNDRNVALVADKALLAPTLAGGSSEWLDPKYVAVAFAAAQCGTAIGTPLTEKVFDFLDISHSWADGTENNVIANNICALYKNANGVVAGLRSVTTNNDNVVYSEVSANESLNMSIFFLRVALKKLIGEPLTSSLPPDVVRGLAIQALDRQVLDGVIKAYKNVAVTLQGDTYSVDYEVAVVQPLNFILVTAHLGQF